MEEWPRIVKVFLDVKPGQNFLAARERAASEGCEFFCFNDRIQPVAPDSVDPDETPECYVWYLRGDFERAIERFDRDRAEMRSASQRWELILRPMR